MRLTSREAPVLRGCLELLRLRGFPCWRMNVGAMEAPSGRFVRYGVSGMADLLALVPVSGRLLAVECKRPGGRPTMAQEAFLDAVRAAGGVALVIDDVATLDRVLAALAARPGARFDEGGRELP